MINTRKTSWIILLIALTLSSCTRDVRFQNITVDASGRTVYHNLTEHDKSEIRGLTKKIMSLSPTVDPDEAAEVAREAILYPKFLANQYRLVSPPNRHNQLVNSGVRERGHCYHSAIDMLAHLDKGYKTLVFRRVVAFQGQYLEHNVTTVSALGQPIEEAILLDAWRHSSDLFWKQVKDDEDYPWKKYTRRVIKPVTLN